MQGDRATLSCQVDANPPVKAIRWLRDGHLLSNQFNLTIGDLKVSDSGLYACQADNGIAPSLAHLSSVVNGPNSLGAGVQSSSFFSFLGFSSNQQVGAQSQPGQSGEPKTTVESRLQLEVLYGPRVRVNELRPMPLSEGDQFSLNCSADAWPPAHEFHWSKVEQTSDGQQVLRRLSSSGSPLLEFQSIQPSDMGNYTCTAINRLEPTPLQGVAQLAVEQQGSGSLVVLVRHKPGPAELSAGTNGETELGNRTQLVCRAKPPGYPEPQYKFWRYQQGSNKYYLNKQNHGPVYQIYQAKQDDEAKYGCMATNAHGSSTEAHAEDRKSNV